MDQTSESTEKVGHKSLLGRIVAPLVEIFGLSWWLASATILALVALLAFTVFWSIHSTPPKIITITSGPPGSVFEATAIKYSNQLAKVNVRVKILPSEGSLENLRRLDNPSVQVDVGFIQGGITNGTNAEGIGTNTLVSLGSISYQPLLVFYRGTNSTGLLTDLVGKRIAVGQRGSGTRTLVLMLLHMNGMDPDGPTTFLDLEAESATRALLEGNVDAVFLMGDSASVSVMRTLIRAPGIHLMDFAQAEGYARRVTYLNHLVLPRGVFDVGNDMPAHDIQLIGPTVELIARPSLHPALSDVLMEAATEVHGAPGIFQKQGEFPLLQEHGFPISPEAERYKNSGKTFLYRKLPFGLAALANFVLVAFVPVLVVAIPALRFIPVLFRWRVKLIFYRWYRALLTLEREIKIDATREKRRQLLSQLEEIDSGVNRIKVPPSFAGEFYALRLNIEFVRAQLVEPDV